MCPPLSVSVDKILSDLLLVPSLHGVACIELVSFKLNSSTIPNEIRQTNEFIQQVNKIWTEMTIKAVAGGAGKAITHVSRQMTRVLINDRPIRGIKPLKAIVEKITRQEEGDTHHDTEGW